MEMMDMWESLSIARGSGSTTYRYHTGVKFAPDSDIEGGGQIQVIGEPTRDAVFTYRGDGAKAGVEVEVHYEQKDREPVYKLRVTIRNAECWDDVYWKLQNRN